MLVKKRFRLVPDIAGTFMQNVISDGGAIADPSLIRSQYADLSPLIRQHSTWTMLTGAYKSGTIYAMNPQNGDAIPISYARNSITHRINSAGRLEEVAVNVPPIHFNEAGVLQGYDIDREEINTATFINDFTNAVWTKTGVTVTADAIESPKVGGFQAQKLDFTGTDSSIKQTGGAHVSASTACAVFLKRIDFDWICIEMTTAAGTNGCRAWFNINTMTAGSGAVIGTLGTFNMAEIEKLANGWIRCCPCGRGTTGTNTQTAMNFYPVTGDGSTTRVNGSCYAWGANIQQSYYITPHISEGNNRAVAEFTTTDLGSTVQQGAFFMELAFSKNSTSAIIFLQSGIYRLWHDNTGGHDHKFMVYDGTGHATSTLTLPHMTMSKAIFGWDKVTTNNLIIYRNGGNGAGRAVNAGFNVGVVTNVTGALALKGIIKTLAFIPGAFTNTEIASITA